MAVPKKRSSRRRRDMRRAHHFLVPTAAAEPCAACGELKLRHQLCAACGSYRGRQVVAQPAAAEPPAAG
jgi:large subunit ribosomal protein L32